MAKLALTSSLVSGRRFVVFGKIGALYLVLLIGFTSCSLLPAFRPGQTSFDQGVALFNQGHFQEAIPHFQRATAENPKFAQAYLYLGRSHLSMRHWREAIQPLRTAHRLSPEETKHEAFNLLIDALLGAAVGGSGQGRSPEHFKDTL
jgi:tetratricopeptide (TPR) repeat protein